MGYFWKMPPVIEVVTDLRGAPHGFTWEAEYHPVRRVLGTWREDTGWWLWRTWRDYYEIATRTGIVVLLFQNLETHTWYLQRMYD